MWLIFSELIKRFTATLTETEKVRNDLYVIGINFGQLHVQVFENVLQKLLREKVFRFSKPIKSTLFVWMSSKWYRIILTNE